MNTLLAYLLEFVVYASVTSNSVQMGRFQSSTSTREDKVSCLRTQQSASSKTRTSDPSISSQVLDQ